MNKKLFWLLAFTFSVALCQPIYADQYKGESAQHASCPCNKMWIKKLDLNDEQQAKIKAIRAQARAVHVMKKDELMTINNQIQELIKLNELDESKLDILINQKKEIMGTLMKSRAMTKHQMYNVLTPAQKAKYEDLIKQEEKQ